MVTPRLVERDHRQILVNDLRRILLNKNNSSPTAFISQENSDEDIDNHSVVKRSLRSCELRRRRKWNHCLGRHFTELHCRRLGVACLSRHNTPPRCKENYKIIFRQNRACRVVKSCTCAAWRHCTPHGELLISVHNFVHHFVMFAVFERHSSYN